MSIIDFFKSRKAPPRPESEPAPTTHTDGSAPEGSKKSPIIGIDLGTTFSLVAVLEGGVPRLIPNALGETLTASAVSVLADGTVLVGAAARAMASTAPDRTAVAFKRDMGLPRLITVGDRTFSPPELSALVLRSLKADAEAALGCPVTEAVITVPAYFSERERAATRDAASLAGLKALRLINEPTAAALAYGLNNRTDDIVSAVVLDLGGGTFDVTVLELIDGAIEVRATAGDGRLGGEDFTEAVLTTLVARVAEITGRRPDAGHAAMARLREIAEGAKRKLSASPEIRVVIPDLHLEGDSKGKGSTNDINVTLTINDIDAAFAPLLERLERPIRRALRDAGLAPSGVQRVLLVGGASRAPCVRALAERLFPGDPQNTLDSLAPDEAIALGAAIQAGLIAGDAGLDDIVATDIASHSLGIATMRQFRHGAVSGLFTPIIERGTVIPVSRSEPFSTMSDGQTALTIEVFQGEHPMCKDNVKLGSYELEGLPPKPAGDVSISVRFSYDPSGLLDVDLAVHGTDRKASFTIEPADKRLAPADLERRRAALDRLKVHPRELLPNITAMNRAEALYVELRGPERDLLSQALSQFQAALDAQDPVIIGNARDILNQVVDRLR